MSTVQNIFRFATSALTNVALLTIVCSVTISGLGLAALYIIKYSEETPEMVKLQCMLGLDRPDCPDNQKKIEALQAKLDTLAKQTAEAEAKLANLRAVENRIDSVTFFATHDDPYSNFKVTVGTQYTKLVEPEPSPAYFCYLSLGQGGDYFERNLHFRSTSGPIQLNNATLRKAGVSNQTMNFARSVCRPTLISEADSE